MPKNYSRKDFRDKVFSGYLIGYSAEGEIGYKIFVPEFKQVMVGVNCTFNEIIPTYEEDYFNEIKKLKFQTAEETNTVEAFNHLVGMKYQDEDNQLEYQNTRVAEFKGYIVVYRAPVLGEDQHGLEEKSPIHVADVVRMMGGYRVGNRGPRTPGGEEVFPNQEVQLDNVDNVKHHGCLEWEVCCPTV